MLSDMEFVNKISIPKELPFWLIPCKMGKQNVKIPYLGNLVLRSSNLRKLTFSPKISAPEYMQNFLKYWPDTSKGTERQADNNIFRNQ